MRKQKALLCTLMTVVLFATPVGTAFADGPASGGVLRTGSSLGLFWVISANTGTCPIPEGDV